MADTIAPLEGILVIDLSQGGTTTKNQVGTNVSVTNFTVYSTLATTPTLINGGAGNDIVYVSRVATSRIMTLSLSVGSRLPAYCTSVGRVLLAALPVEEQRRHLSKTKLVAHTKFTLHSEAEILAELESETEEDHA